MARRAQRPPLSVGWWWAILGLIIAAFVTAVATLNASLYSADAFVTEYLEAIGEGDAAAALATPGVTTRAAMRDELLTNRALSDIADVEVVSVTDADGTKDVRVTYLLDGAPAESTFRITHTGLRMGLFNSWAFAESPVSSIEVLPLHDRRLTINGVQLALGAGSSTGTWQVLVPGRYVVGHESQYLTADARPLVATRPSALHTATVEVRANERFVSDVQQLVHEFLLEECAPQQVLFPTGCPFGHSVFNRVVSAPEWTIPQLPTISIQPGDETGTWVVTDAPGTAHLSVDVQSLFDGSVTRLEEDVPFTLSWTVTIGADDDVTVD